MTDATCSIDGCDTPSRVRGWCDRHYKRWRRHGDPQVVLCGPGAPDAVERFWAKVDVGHPLGCWVWTASTRQRYGLYRIWYDRTHQAHRFAYELLRGPIPEGVVLDHLCRNTVCVNPDHLTPTTDRDNILRSYNPPAQNARKTHCVHGHPFDAANTMLRRDGGRRCRTCAREQERERYRRRRR